MHFAVMAPQAMEYLAVRPDGTYLDATAGLGGHTAEIARRLTTGKVIANDRDPESLEMARRNTAAWADRICFHQRAVFAAGGEHCRLAERSRWTGC